MKEFKEKYKLHFTNKDFNISLVSGLMLLLVSLVINFYAGTYALERASNSVNDIVLSNIPVFDVDIIFIYGPLILWIFVGALCLRAPNKIPFVLKSIALFIFVRSAFITMTHIGPFPDHVLIDPTSDLVKKFTFGADLFFSAHTGLPFLMALVFGNDHKLKKVFTGIAVFFGVIVLMGHLHYTIDVISAFFITYTIFHLAELFFKKDRALFLLN